MFQGACVALVTPMNANGEVDVKAFSNLVEWHIDQGTRAIVVSGSTGESATLTAPEQLQLYKRALDVANKRIPIIAGSGTNSTQSTIERTQAAEALGVDACLIVTPYYNRPTQPGLLAHYQAIDRAVNVPIILYNVPTRTACDLLPDTVAELSYSKNIIGIKEATGNMARLEALKNQCAKDFLLYTGDDPTTFEFLQRGGHGAISITSNVAPNLMQKMCQAVIDKDFAAAHRYESKLEMLHRMMIVEPNPIPVKWALHYMGKIGQTLRLPLLPLSERHHQNLIQALTIAESEILQ